MDATLVRANPPINVPVNAAAVKSTAATASGNAIPKSALYCTFQLIATAAATVVIEVTNDATTAQGTTSNWLLLATMSTTAAGTDGFGTSVPWAYCRARITANAGTVNVLMGC